MNTEKEAWEYLASLFNKMPEELYADEKMSTSSGICLALDSLYSEVEYSLYDNMRKRLKDYIKINHPKAYITQEYLFEGAALGYNFKSHRKQRAAICLKLAAECEK